MCRNDQIRALPAHVHLPAAASGRRHRAAACGDLASGRRTNGSARVTVPPALPGATPEQTDAGQRLPGVTPLLRRELGHGHKRDQGRPDALVTLVRGRSMRGRTW